MAQKVSNIYIYIYIFIAQILFLVIINSFEDFVSHWMITSLFFFFFFFNFQRCISFWNQIAFFYSFLYFICNLSFFYQPVNKAVFLLKTYVNTLRLYSKFLRNSIKAKLLPQRTAHNKHKTMSAIHTSIPARHEMLKKIEMYETRFHGIFKAKGKGIY